MACHLLISFFQLNLSAFYSFNTPSKGVFFLPSLRVFFILYNNFLRFLCIRKAKAKKQKNIEQMFAQ